MCRCSFTADCLIAVAKRPDHFCLICLGGLLFAHRLRMIFYQQVFITMLACSA